MTGRKIWLWVMCLFFLFSVQKGFAHTLGTSNTKCPLCGTEFSYTASMSGSSYGTRLDFKIIGPIYQPWPIPQCPKCRYAFYARNAWEGEEELAPEKIRILKQYMESPEFKSIPDNAPSYFYLARFLEVMGERPFSIMFTYLKASWQAEGSEELDSGRTVLGWANDPAMQQMALREALRCVNGAKEAEEGLDRIVAFYLEVELNRRLGEFAVARDCLPTVRAEFDILKQNGKDLAKQSDFFGALPYLLDQQEKLIASQNGEPAVFDTSVFDNDE